MAIRRSSRAGYGAYSQEEAHICIQRKRLVVTSCQVYATQLTTSSSYFVAPQTWTFEVEKQIAVRMKISSHFQSILAKLFELWKVNADLLRQKKEAKIRSVLFKIQNRVVVACFLAWATRTRQRCGARRLIKRISNRLLYVVIVAWKEKVVQMMA